MHTFLPKRLNNNLQTKTYKIIISTEDLFFSNRCGCYEIMVTKKFNLDYLSLCLLPVMCESLVDSL